MLGGYRWRLGGCASVGAHALRSLVCYIYIYYMVLYIYDALQAMLAAKGANKTKTKGDDGGLTKGGGGGVVVRERCCTYIAVARVICIYIYICVCCCAGDAICILLAVCMTDTSLYDTSASCARALLHIHCVRSCYIYMLCRRCNLHPARGVYD